MSAAMRGNLGFTIIATDTITSHLAASQQEGKVRVCESIAKATRTAPSQVLNSNSLRSPQYSSDNEDDDLSGADIGNIIMKETYSDSSR